MTIQQRIQRKLKQSWDTVTLAVLVITLMLAALPLSQIAGWIPRTVLGICLVLIVSRLIAEWAPLRQAPDTSQQPGIGEGTASPAHAVSWIAGLLLAVLLIGMTAGSTVFCFAYLRWYARESWVLSSIFALVLGSSVQLVFGTLLQATLYQGWLPGLF